MQFWKLGEYLAKRGFDGIRGEDGRRLGDLIRLFPRCCGLIGIWIGDRWVGCVGLGGNGGVVEEGKDILRVSEDVEGSGEGCEEGMCWRALGV